MILGVVDQLEEMDQKYLHHRFGWVCRFLAEFNVWLQNR
jgi:hypothetical protein